MAKSVEFSSLVGLVVERDEGGHNDRLIQRTGLHKGLKTRI
jgi:hypothetical protein